VFDRLLYRPFITFSAFAACKAVTERSALVGVSHHSFDDLLLSANSVSIIVVES
jgi:hypothetical protein